MMTDGLGDSERGNDRKPPFAASREDRRPHCEDRAHRPGLRGPSGRHARGRNGLPGRRLRHVGRTDRVAAERTVVRRGHPRRATPVGARPRLPPLARSARPPCVRDRRDHRADPTQRRRSRPLVHRVGRSRPGAAPRTGSARRARVDDVPGHDRGAPAPDPRDLRPHGGHRLLPRLLARAHRPGQPLVEPREHAEGRIGNRPRVVHRSRSVLRRRWSTRSCRWSRRARPSS